MPYVERSVLVPYAAEKMFDLVSDVESYPDFVPGCAAACSRVAGGGRRLGTLEIDTRGIKHRFTTENELTRPERVVMRLVSGPFRRLQGEWRFEALAAEAARVTLKVDFEVAAGPLRKVFTAVFEDLLGSLIDSFVRRARELHGRGA